MTHRLFLATDACQQTLFKSLLCNRWLSAANRKRICRKRYLSNSRAPSASVLHLSSQHKDLLAALITTSLMDAYLHTPSPVPDSPPPGILGEAVEALLTCDTPSLEEQAAEAAERLNAYFVSIDYHVHISMRPSYDTLLHACIHKVTCECVS